ncbi:dUTP diphosphatase [Aquifex aeolicus]|uniref:Deoxyuridine 5'-triphosphate nucleotidohydrolase n=1 Tax=Aquifex aeolicus (strain VF5) TaxID=224324 RepID=DUT_AQUAE|nr:dUTP diphosphatase [Aquifex aeolicus]O66592.1 RecName: Full=Deoxyuridine 5'-triphosphate nucleotidohydrolase; Short=dUTPase; AltName: Full=dUTP pyrophosphatase [Aquifex aeolicus VF5]AAC06559.1 deoxyuridine 5'triphosphate nucleotidohydrolase [Aquifex aeolicus VF5]
MSKVILKIKRLPHAQDLPLPSYATPHSSGLDLRAAIEKPLKIKPFERVLIPTGLILEIPEGYEGQVRPRSGLAWKKGLTVLNAPGTIDADYRGEVKVILVNLGNEEVVIERGERIAQLVIAPVQRVEVVEVEEVSQTQRGEGGFGSTGTK